MHNSIHSSFDCIILLCAGSSNIWLSIMKITVQLTEGELHHTEIDEEYLQEIINQVVDDVVYADEIKVVIEIIKENK